MNIIKSGTIIFTVWIVLILTSCGRKNYKCDQLLTLNKFKVGQVWSYKNREGEDSSTLTILKIERYDRSSDKVVSLDTIIQIRVDGIKFIDRRSETGVSTFAENIPLIETALLKSVVRLQGENGVLPESNSEYDQWQSLWDKSKAWPFNIAVREILEHYYPRP